MWVSTIAGLICMRNVERSASWFRAAMKHEINSLLLLIVWHYVTNFDNKTVNQKFKGIYAFFKSRVLVLGNDAFS